MPQQPPIFASIRSSMIGELTDFVTESGFGMAELHLVVELVYELADYREEGVSFFPSVYVVKRADDGDALAPIAPSADRILLEDIQLGVGSGAAILKNCATLAEGGWSIIIEVSDASASASYGVFRSEQLPISVSSADLLADPDTQSGVAILVRNCSNDCVELITGFGKRMEFALTSAKPVEVSVSEAFAQLANQATFALGGELQTSSRAFLGRLLFEITQRCHGTIIVVVPSTLGVLPETLSDGVVLHEPIDLVAAFQELQHDKSASTLARLESREAILRGMIQSDGITVLSADGKVLAFRVFVKPSEAEREAMEQIDIRGGARSRAHELLKLRLGNQLTCVFFRSQDGKTRCTVNQ